MGTSLLLAAIAVRLSVVVSSYFHSFFTTWNSTEHDPFKAIAARLLVFAGAVVTGALATKTDDGSHPRLFNVVVLFIGPILVGIAATELRRRLQPERAD